jgi:PAS domain S-box-containing protein
MTRKPTYEELEQRVKELANEAVERKQAEEDLKMMSKVFMEAADPILIEDLEGHVINMNAEAERSYGWSRDELIGQEIKAIVPPERHDQAGELLERCKAGKEVRNIEGLRWTKEGKTVPVLLTLSLLKDVTGKAMGVATLAKDISAQKRVEEVLRLHRDRLAETVEERTRDLALARDEAEAATLAKSDFLANMSHEIRTPMNAIIGLSYLALKTELTPKQHDYINKVQFSSNALLGIINDILDFSKIEAGKLDMESVPFHLEDVLENLANLVGLKTEEKGLKLLFEVNNEVPTELVGDPLRLGQIMINLANNAVKFTDTGQIVVGVSPVAVTDEKAELQFSVQDSGIGLTKEQCGKLFQAFSQADTSTTRKYGGTGLGLTISKKLTEMMDGKIWVESEPGVGSTFIFTAVFGRHSEKRSERSIAKGDIHGLDNIRGARILLAEDNEINQQIAQEILEQVSLAVEMANNGREAVEMAEKNTYDVILMDIQMPEMNGFEATKEIRNLKSDIRNVPIIAMTAHAMAGDREKSIEGGMNDHVTKPIDPNELFAALIKWIKPGEREIPEQLAPKIEEKTEEKPLADMPGISVTEGLARVGGNTKFYIKILTKFNDDYSDATKQIKDALDKGNQELAQRLAHTVKGVAGNIGAKDLSGPAGELEAAIKHQKADEFEGLLSGFADALKVVLNSLKHAVEVEDKTEKEKTVSEAADPKMLLELLLKLEPHLKKRKPKPCKEVLGEISGFSWPDEYLERIADLNKMVGKYKFKDAGDVLEGMIKRLRK